jgi:MSHA biogenesis protein MshM
MYRQFFGLKQIPFGKEGNELWDNGQHKIFVERFEWLLKSPGIGLLTAEPGLGKTSLLRQVTRSLNPHQYMVYYISETDFTRFDIYRQMAILLGLTPAHRCSQVWRDIKEYITNLVTQKNILPIFIIDEAHNLPVTFLKDLPSFTNFLFDSKDYMTIWLVGHSELARTIDRAQFRALASRIQVRYELQPIADRDKFKQFIVHGFAQAGCTYSLLSDPAIELIYMSSNGNPRLVHVIVIAALRLATDRKINHLPDDIVNAAIESLKHR